MARTYRPRNDGNRPGEWPSALAEPYAFALVTWPAVVGLMATWPAEWADYARIALGLWLAAMQLAAYGGGRGWGFGNVMLTSSGVVALSCWTHPSPWTLAWLPPLLITLHAAQRMVWLRLARTTAQTGAAVADPTAAAGEPPGHVTAAPASAQPDSLSGE